MSENSKLPDLESNSHKYIKTEWTPMDTEQILLDPKIESPSPEPSDDVLSQIETKLDIKTEETQENEQFEAISINKCDLDEMLLIKSENNETFHNSAVENVKNEIFFPLRFEPVFLCGTCSQSFTSDKQLRHHLETAHNNDSIENECYMEKSYDCKVCGKSYKTSSSLSRHKRIHTREKLHSCKTCEKTFPDTAHLRIHERIHTGERPYSCNECGKSFTTSNYLNVHQRIHTQTKPYVCKECGKSFNSVYNFTTHLRTHTGEKPFSCKECGKVFTTKPELKVHERVHTDIVLQEDEEIGNSSALRTRLQRKYTKNTNWIPIHVFETINEAEIYINKQNTWEKCSVKKTLEETKIEYRCKFGQLHKNECPARIYLLYDNNSLNVTIYSTELKHANHTNKLKYCGLDEQTRMCVTKLFCLGIEKPNAIISAMKRDNIMLKVNKSKLTTFLVQLRKKKEENKAIISIPGCDLMVWCQQRNTVPDLSDVPFVLDFKLDYNQSFKDQDLKIVLSTVRLLEQLNQSDLIQIDTTCKVLWQGFSVLIVGTSDKCNRFHPLCVAICKGQNEEDFTFIFNSLKKYNVKWKPKILLTNANNTITKAFDNLNLLRLTCFFHVIKNVEKKLKILDNNSSVEELRTDINLLQKCNNERIFLKASELFLNKWKSKEDKKINEFLNYFNSEWFQKNPNWFEGAAFGYPNTNIGLETLISIIKKENTLRERLAVNPFLNNLTNLIIKWSKDRDPSVSPNHQLFTNERILTNNQWLDAYEWVLSNQTIIKIDNKFYICSSKSNEFGLGLIITNDLIVQYNLFYENWTTFDEFKIWNFGIWVVTESDLLDNFTCTCPVFVKDCSCKHILGLQIRLKLKTVPDETKLIYYNEKKKRGRPMKARKAILIQ